MSTIILTQGDVTVTLERPEQKKWGGVTEDEPRFTIEEIVVGVLKWLKLYKDEAPVSTLRHYIKTDNRKYGVAAMFPKGGAK
jgi:hypothetical protein